MAKPVRARTRVPRRGAIFGICALLVAITWLTFGQTLAHQFVNYDDETYVYENPRVAAGLSLQNAVWAFTHIVCYNWHPLTVLSHMFDCQLYGLNPGGHHFTNVLLHTIAVILLFLVLRQMTGALWRSAFVAALFAIHPLHVESVAWVAERKDVLSAVLFMLTLGAYTRYVRTLSLTSYLIVLLLFALGLTAKPMLVTLPFVLLLLDYWPLNRFAQESLAKSNDRRGTQRRANVGRIFLEKIPLLLLSAGSCLVTVVAQHHFIDPIDKLSLIERLGNAAVATMVYVRQMVLPIGLSVFYPHPRHSLSITHMAVAVLLLIAISAAAFVLRRKHAYFLTGWCWFLGMLVPVIGIVQVGVQAHADRYTYLPQIGLYILVTWLVADMSISRQNRGIVLGPVMAFVVLILMWCAWKQTTYWRDSRALWMHALEVNPENDSAHNALSDVAFRESRLDEAVFHAGKALKIRPDSADAHSNLGVALSGTGRREEARIQFQKVIDTSPNRPRVHYNLGTLLLDDGRLDDAIAEFEKELKIQPDFLDAHNNLGIVLTRKGELDDALAHFQKALEMDSGRPKVHYNVATVLLQTGQRDQAIAHLKKELQINPASAEAHNDLGIAWSQEGRIDQAISEWQKTLELQPNNLNAHYNLAWIFATFPDDAIRNGTKAVSLAESALHLSGERDPRIYRLLAAAYAENGQFDEAIETAQRGSHLAIEQENYALADRLESNVDLYRRSAPLRDTSQSKP
jgi:protein O-mannosyl-transferase